MAPAVALIIAELVELIRDIASGWKLVKDTAWRRPALSSKPLCERAADIRPVVAKYYVLLLGSKKKYKKKNKNKIKK